MTAEDPLSRLSAGLDRDEQLARAAGGADWAVTKVPYEGIQVWVGEDDPLGRTDSQTAHIAEQDPARILERYVPAIRKVIARHEEAERDSVLSERDAGFEAGLYAALECLASIYEEAVKAGGTHA